MTKRKMEKIPEHLEGKKELYFHQGKFYENSDDFWRDVKQWPLNKLDQETAQSLFKSFSKDCIMNIFLLGVEMKNSDMANLLEEMFFFFIKKIHK